MTVQEYNDQLAHLKHLDPDHYNIPRLEQGYSITNETRLERALASLPPPPAPEARRSSDAIMDRFYTELNKEFTKRAKLSNSFHKLIYTDADGMMTMTHESDAKNIVVEIETVQAAIADLLHRMRTYETTKELLPPSVSDDTFTIPTDPIELMKKQSSLRSNLSRAKSEIKKVSKKHNADKWLKVNENIQRLTVELEYVNKAISGHNTK